MDKKDWIFLIVILYLISLLPIGFFNNVIIETEFCQEHGFEEYRFSSGVEDCVKKQFEKDELFFETKAIYCERDILKTFYYQPITNTCFFLKEVVE